MTNKTLSTLSSTAVVALALAAESNIRAPRLRPRYKDDNDRKASPERKAKRRAAKAARRKNRR